MIDSESTTIESKPPATKAKRRVRGPRIGPRSAGMRMTVDEFDALPPSQWLDGYRYEVIRGVLVVSPMPGAGERSPNDELGHLIRQYLETHPQGSIIDDTLPEQTVAATNRRRADRVIWVGLGRAR